MVDCTSNTLDIFIIGDIEDDKIDRFKQSITQQARE